MKTAGGIDVERLKEKAVESGGNTISGGQMQPLKKVLIVDDSSIIRKLIEKHLSKLDLEIVGSLGPAVIYQKYPSAFS